MAGDYPFWAVTAGNEFVCLPERQVSTLPNVPQVDHLDQYFGLWCIEPNRFMRTWEAVTKMDLAAHVAKAETRSVATTPTRTEDVAVIDIEGSLTKRGSSLSGASSLIELRRQVRSAANDSTVSGIVLRIDSPGGTSAGTADLANEVRAANKKKPVFAFVEDMAASAAFWVASQAEKIFVNDKTAEVGSIGTFIGLFDMSEAAKNEGIRPVVIKSGEFKGAGFPGTEITPEIEGNLQELVDKTQAVFTEAVANGRGMTVKQIEKLADGRVHVAEDAIEMGLADGIKTFDQTLRALAGAIKERRTAVSKPKSEVVVMDPKQVATLEDLKLHCIGADSNWIVEQLSKQATLDQAISSWIECQNETIDGLYMEVESYQEDIAKRDARIEELEAEKKTKPPGVEPLGQKEGGPRTGGDAKEMFESLVSEHMSATGCTRSKAWAAVARANPALREQLIEESNVSRSA